MQALIGRSKSMGVPMADHPDSVLFDIERTYNRELKLLNAVDFDDLLILGVKVLNEHPDVRSEWQKRFRYIMVDEFQDTNRQQMQLVTALAGASQNVCVVGDDDQSIYGWRGADITNILEFERHFSNPKVIKIEQNYRSTTPILHTANSIIRHNQGRREKSLWSENPGKENVRVVAMPDDKEEAQLIVDEIIEGEATEQREYDDFAVLFRTNSQSRAFEGALREAKIPYRVIGGQSFYDRREIKDLIAYLCVLANPDDDVNLLRILNNPPRGIGAATVEIATERSRDLGRGIYEVLESEDYQKSIPPKARGAVLDFLAFMERYRDPMLVKSATFGTMFQKMIDEMEFIDYLKRTCKTDQESEKRQKAISEFLEFMRDSEGKGLQKFLDGVALQAEKEDDIESQKGVSLITLHASKGLEFPVVYLVGTEEGILPHSRSMEEGTRDEERRLFYVGITRAMERLTISFCSTRKKWGETQSCQRSTFLDELDPTYLDIHSYDELAATPIEEDAAMDYFAKMKAMIGGGDSGEK